VSELRPGLCPSMPGKVTSSAMSGWLALRGRVPSLVSSTRHYLQTEGSLMCWHAIGLKLRPFSWKRM